MDDQNPALSLSLTRGMARRLGVDLNEAVTAGWFTRKEMEALLAACAACGQTSDCLPWLDKNRKADALPPFCHNKAPIEALSP